MENREAVKAVLSISLGFLLILLVSTDKVTAILMFAIIFLAFAILISAYSTMSLITTVRETREQIERSLQLTEKMLCKAETKQNIRHIQESFNLFYYPLKDYLDGRSEIMIRPREYIEKIALYRYLATEKTRKQFEVFQKGNYDLHTDDSQLLLQYIINDINILERELKY